jgi:acetylornithine/N-succinyldiaminopimelate aminotransferase
MNTNQSLYDEGMNCLMNTYSRLPIVFKKAKMQYLWDFEGKKYIDFIAGYGCLNVGHSNPFVIKRIKGQINELIQPSNVYFNAPQIELAKKLCSISSFGKKVFFANSGTEAIEGSIKLARKYSTEKYSQERYEIISFYGSFHGRTLGALSATAQPDKQRLFEPLLGGFRYADFNDISSVKENINKNTSAILIEPIQGEGGINVCDEGFLKELRKLCDEHNILLILDEIQTGFARTGKFFAYENFGILPDILVVAKSLGGGMPIGAIISTEEISRCFSPGTHGSTFGGNAASCAAGSAVIEYIEERNLNERAKDTGNYFKSRLQQLEQKHSIIKDVRGMGLMLALEFNKPVAASIVTDALKDSLVLNKVSEYTLRFLPPIIINKNNISKLIKWLDRKIKLMEKNG